MRLTNSPRIVRYGLVLYFLLPFIFFAYKFKFSLGFNFNEVWWALKSSVLQATTAAIAVSLLAVPVGLALYSLPIRSKEVAKQLLLLPQILPVFFTALILFSLINPFPIGSTGIIILFVVINLGLAAVLIEQSINDKLPKLAIVSEVFSISKINFFIKVFLPRMQRDLWHVFFLIFTFCISSFSIPLIAGDGRSANLEMLVYEKVFIENNWIAACNIGLFQSLAIFLISHFIYKKDINELKEAPSVAKTSYLQSKIGAALGAAYLSFYLGGYLVGILRSVSYLDFLSQYSTELFAALWFSMKALALCLMLSFMLLMLWLYDFIKNKKFSPVLGFFSLSTVVVGFSFYLFFPVDSKYDLFKLPIAFSILFFPALFKIFLQKPIEVLSRQLQIAEVYGLSSTQIIIDIILRQIKTPFFLWIGVLSLWLTADYAVSRAVGLQSQTFGLISESFLSSYRMPAAYLMSLIIVLTILLCLPLISLMMKVSYVAYKKLTF